MNETNSKSLTFNGHGIICLLPKEGEPYRVYALNNIQLMDSNGGEVNFEEFNRICGEVKRLGGLELDS